jgi:hypothetical protein
MTTAQQYRKRERLVIAVFVSWAALTTAALFALGNQYYGVFAAQGNWQTIAERELSVDALGLRVSQGFQIVHVRQKGCMCNRQADKFKTFLASEHNVNKGEQYDVDITQLTKLGIALPTSPAVLIFQQGKLLYAGPYASGPLCSVDESLITPILQNRITLPGLWLNGEAKSCRCINVV